MKKLTLFFLTLFALGFGFQACDDTKTYAEMLEEEEDAIKAFIQDSSIVVISQSQFYAQDSITDVRKNEFVQLASGVYMQIVDRGSVALKDTMKPNDLLLVRFEEYGLIGSGKDNQKSYLSNVSDPTWVDEFRYSVTPNSIAGLFLNGLMMTAYQSAAVPAGWLVPISFIRDGAHVKLIVPSKMGHNTAMQSVLPYYYDIHKYQIWK